MQLMRIADRLHAQQVHPAGVVRGQRMSVQAGPALARVLFWVLVIPSLVALVGGQLGCSYLPVEEAHRLARAEDLLVDTVNAVAAYPFDEVARMDGSAFQGGCEGRRSDFKVELAVTRASEDMLKVSAVLWDLRSSQEISRLITYRGRG